MLPRTHNFSEHQWKNLLRIWMQDFYQFESIHRILLTGWNWSLILVIMARPILHCRAALINRIVILREEKSHSWSMKSHCIRSDCESELHISKSVWIYPEEDITSDRLYSKMKFVENTLELVSPMIQLILKNLPEVCVLVWGRGIFRWLKFCEGLGNKHKRYLLM